MQTIYDVNGWPSLRNFSFGRDETRHVLVSGRTGLRIVCDEDVLPSCKAGTMWSFVTEEMENSELIPKNVVAANALCSEELRRSGMCVF